MVSEKRLENIINGFCQLKAGKSTFYKGLHFPLLKVDRGMIYELFVYGTESCNRVLWLMHSYVS